MNPYELLGRWVEQAETQRQEVVRLVGVLEAIQQGAIRPEQIQINPDRSWQINHPVLKPDLEAESA